MKIYTKTGDTGKTSLLGGKRVEKYDLRIEAYGTVDELNAQIGFLTTLVSKDHFEFIVNIQNTLFNIGSNLASENPSEYGLNGVSNNETKSLEQSMDEMNEVLPPLKNFIIPGTTKQSAQAHICRCVCRRAERRTVALADTEDVQAEIIVYLNRLSDWFFVLGRFLLHEEGFEDRKWSL